MAKKKKKTGKKHIVLHIGSLKKRDQIILRVVAAILALVIVMTGVYFLILRQDAGDVSIAGDAVGSAVNIVEGGVSKAVGFVKGFVAHWREYDDLEAKYLALKRQNDQMSQQLVAAEETELENQRLSDLLGAYQRYNTLDPIYAEVIARDPGQWFYTFSINRGSADGIPNGAAVVTGDGLIGRVTEVGTYYAKVLCIVDARSKLACLIQRTRDNGILQGHSSDKDYAGECYVYYLPNLNSVSPGDTVVTSGTDMLYPKGIKVGTVTAVCLDAGSDGSYAVIEPSADFRHIEEVIVLRNVVETDTDALPSGVSVTPEPGLTIPQATPTPSPTPAANLWSYPTNESGDLLQYDSLPEDDWARDTEAK